MHHLHSYHLFVMLHFFFGRFKPPNSRFGWFRVVSVKVPVERLQQIGILFGVSITALLVPFNKLGEQSGETIDVSIMTMSMSGLGPS